MNREVGPPLGELGWRSSAVGTSVSAIHTAEQDEPVYLWQPERSGRAGV